MKETRTLAIRITKEAGVATIPVSVFYHDQKDDKVLRFCFSKKKETLEAAVETINQNLKLFIKSSRTDWRPNDKNVRYKGILFMLMARIGFSMMGGAAKVIKRNFHCWSACFLSKCNWLALFLVPGLLNKTARSTWRKILTACLSWH